MFTNYKNHPRPHIKTQRGRKTAATFDVELILLPVEAGEGEEEGRNITWYIQTCSPKLDYYLEEEKGLNYQTILLPATKQK